MTNTQLRLQVEQAAQQWVALVMQQYGVSATMMEQAFTKVLLNLKDLVMQETVEAILQEQTPETEEVEEEQDDRRESESDTTINR